MTLREQERQEAQAKLREWLKPGDEVRTILRHVSRSGMSRSVSAIIDGEDWSGFVAKAIGSTFDRNNGGVKMGGAGMDMGFALVYELSYSLWPDGFQCSGEGCPSNDHVNPPRPAADGKMMHKESGYALRQKWL